MYVKPSWHDDAPTEPHLAVLTKDGFANAIPRGAVMLLVENAASPEGIIPLVLGKVSKKYIDFKCACGASDCTRRVRFAAKWEGRHIQKY